MKKLNNNNKIANDKYYTSKELAKYVVDKTIEVIGGENITEFLEPSAGDGVFLDVLDDLDKQHYKAYDIEPDDNKDRILEQDYLELELDHKEGRCCIGNPPFGRANKLSVQFFNKAVNECDYVSFILPITQLNNNYDFYKFDMVHSEDLGLQNYSDRSVHCCLNIFKRNKSGMLNKREVLKLRDIDIQDYHRSRPTSHKRSSKEMFDYDIRICGTGSSVGREVMGEGQYVRELSIRVNNEGLKDEVLDVINNSDWKKICMGSNGQVNIAKWRLNKHLKEQIPELN